MVFATLYKISQLNPCAESSKKEKNGSSSGQALLTSNLPVNQLSLFLNKFQCDAIYQRCTKLAVKAKNLGMMMACNQRREKCEGEGVPQNKEACTEKVRRKSPHLKSFSNLRSLAILISHPEINNNVSSRSGL